MIRITRTIHIDAPVERVFGFLEDKTHLPEIWPSMIEVSDEQPLENGGKRFHWVYKMAGVLFEGDTEETEFLRNRRIVSTSRQGVENETVWDFKPIGDGTEVTFGAAYTIPIPLVDKFAEPLLAKMNAAEAELVLTNLKARLEG